MVVFEWNAQSNIENEKTPHTIIRYPELKGVIEEENAYRNHILTIETDGRGEGQDHDDGGGNRPGETRSQEDAEAGREEGGSPARARRIRPQPQTSHELEARVAEQEATRAEKEAEQRKADAAEKKAREE